MNYPKIIEQLIEDLSKLPSVGPKTAQRYIFYWLKQNDEDLKRLAQNIYKIKSELKKCQRCQVYNEQNLCSICQNQSRKKEVLCLVESTQDLWTLEKTKQFTGQYFVLGGLINTIERIGPANLSLEKLDKLINEENIKELIIALNFTIEGETTATYLKKRYAKIKISRLAKGLPLGSDLEYIDDLTLGNALKYRQDI
jgi:recombination protein RecR